MTTRGARGRDVATALLRAALGIAFLSAVADRLGLWGAAGAANVAWGNFDNFLAYTAILNPYLPAVLVPGLGWFVTVLEAALGLALLAGVRLRPVALASGLLLAAFGIAMALTTGVKAPLDYSVFTASAGALLLATANHDPWSVDAWRRRAPAGG